MYEYEYIERLEHNLGSQFLPFTLFEAVSCLLLGTPGWLDSELTGLFLSLPRVSGALWSQLYTTVSGFTWIQGIQALAIAELSLYTLILVDSQNPSSSHHWTISPVSTQPPIIFPWIALCLVFNAKSVVCYLFPSKDWMGQQRLRPSGWVCPFSSQ